MTNQDVIINLYPKNGEFPDTTFLAFPDVRRDMLATALAAITSNLWVWVHLNGTTEFSTIERIIVLSGTPT